LPFLLASKKKSSGVTTAWLSREQRWVRQGEALKAAARVSGEWKRRKNLATLGR